MRAVKGKDTSPEILVRTMLHRSGYRYRLHRRDLPGKPDIVFPSKKKAVFVNGCFWHGHHCNRGARKPKTNTEYWENKIQCNRVRDKRHRIELGKLGWKTCTIWECELRKPEAVLTCLKKFLSQ